MRWSNIHTHSNFSDGKFSPEEMLCRAIERNFISYGLSDHSETPLDLSYCMKRADYPRYLARCRDLKERYAGQIEFFCGIEKDRDSRIDYANFDYVVGSVHYILGKDGTYYPIDHTLAQQQDYIAKVGRGDPLELARRYFDLVAEHAQKEPFQVQGHFDVITKFGVFDGAGEAYEKIALEALDEVLKHVPYIEVNTGGIFRGYRKAPYPEEFLLKRILEKGGRVMLNGDSHHVDAVDFFFEESVALLKKVGFTSLWQLRDGGFTEVAL